MDNWGTRLAHRLFKPTENDEVVRIALSLMPNEVEQRALGQYLTEHKALSLKLRKHTYLLDEPQEPLRRWHLSNLFVNYGILLAENRDFQGASTSFLYALVLYENNPLAWGCCAELCMQWEDQIAARWAKKLLDFRPNKSTLTLLTSVFPEGVYPEMIKGSRAKMRSIIKACSEHPEWRDSYPLKRGIPFFFNLFG